MSSAAGLDIHFTGDDEKPSSPTLQAVTSVPSTPGGTPATPTLGATTRMSGLEKFEKAEVARTEIKISGAATINTNDGTAISLDDRIRVVGEMRVTKIAHYVDKKGEVVRVQYVTPCDDLELCPWDPANPNDDGIVRARP